MPRSTNPRLIPLAFALFAVTLVHGALMPSYDLLADAVLRRDGDGHHNPNAPPLIELNETEITMYHAPIPESYYTIDWDGAGEPGPRYPALIMTHVVLMCLAFFVALPMGKNLMSSPPFSTLIACA